MIDDTYSIEANRDHGNSKAPAVRQVRTSSYFGDKCNRTITILRHKHLQDDPTRSTGKVVAQAKRYDGDVRYAYLDVIPVGLLALQRMYGRELAKKLGWTYEPIMNMIALRLCSCLDDDKMTMMCSEYIYRCFTESEAELAIEVVDPLDTLTQRDGISGCSGPPSPPITRSLPGLRPRSKVCGGSSCRGNMPRYRAAASAR